MSHYVRGRILAEVTCLRLTSGGAERKTCRARTDSTGNAYGFARHGSQGDPYDVLLVLMDGSTQVFATHG